MQLLSFWTLSTVQYSKEHKRFGNRISIYPQLKGQKVPTLLVPLKRANLNSVNLRYIIPPILPMFSKWQSWKLKMLMHGFSLEYLKNFHAVLNISSSLWVKVVCAVNEHTPKYRSSGRNQAFSKKKSSHHDFLFTISNIYQCQKMWNTINKTDVLC